MKSFAGLYYALHTATKSDIRVDILLKFLKKASDDDILYLLALIIGQRPKRVVSATMLRSWAAEKAGLPAWLIEESYAAVGDYAEMVAMLLPNPKTDSTATISYWIRYLTQLRSKTEEDRKTGVWHAWEILNKEERFIFNKLATATFRISVSQSVLIRALSIHTQIPGNVLAHRISSPWAPDKMGLHELLGGENSKDTLSEPFPFSLEFQVTGNVEDLGFPDVWQAEWKFDGLRVQIIKRGGHLFIWARGDALITDKFPELIAVKDNIPEGTVLEGEMLPFARGQILPFSQLNARMRLKNLSPKILADTPVVFYASDLLEWEGRDTREKPLSERRMLLEQLIPGLADNSLIQVAPVIFFNSWTQLGDIRKQSRDKGAIGIILKQKNAAYTCEDIEHNWLLWKADLLNLDVVLIYAMKGNGRRSNLYTDYTFGIWKGDALISIAKANSGLSEKELIEVDAWINKNALEKFGPVRTVKPELVFEIGFESIQRSARHKSGLSLHNPVILNWRKDKTIHEAGRIENLYALPDIQESVF